MSKLCSSCGASVNDDTSFCPSCGAILTSTASSPVATEPSYYPEEPTATNNKSTLIGIGVIAVALILVIVLIFSLTGGRSGYKKPLNNYFKGLAKGDWKTFSSALPKEMSEELGDYGDQMMEALSESLEQQFGDNIKITYKIKEKKKLDKDAIKELVNELEEDDIKFDISQAYQLKLEVTIKGDDDDKTDNIKLAVGKVDGKWCLVGGDDFLS